MIGRKSPPPEQLLALLEATIRDAPQFTYQEDLANNDRAWLGRADALIEASGAIPALVSFRTAREALGSYSHSRDKLLIPLHDAYSRVELSAPAALKGAFIPGGDTWNGYAALVSIMQTECDDLLIVDPYLNSVIYTDLAPHSAARKIVRCLAAKRPEYHPGLLAAAGKWEGDNISKSHPVEVRYAPQGSLHDRLIILDGKVVWLISQSLKDIAKKSPASVSRAEAELGTLKVQHYNDLWDKSDPLA
ncbi:hypothetical protein [Sphingomonas sp. MM-1]|uniref:hypothetical protein n=1 Tax=Sphingomonas sp. MM-1 TaxID=745310 RepID=UPI000AE2F473|nr:hypothetical protein [Sphingomonas sp. MM-1]